MIVTLLKTNTSMAVSLSQFGAKVDTEYRRTYRNRFLKIYGLSQPIRTTKCSNVQIFEDMFHSFQKNINNKDLNGMLIRLNIALSLSSNALIILRANPYINGPNIKEVANKISLCV